MIPGCTLPAAHSLLSHLLFSHRTLIKHTKALDLTRPVTYITDSNYARDKGVSFPALTTMSAVHLSENLRSTLVVSHILVFQLKS